MLSNFNKELRVELSKIFASNRYSKIMLKFDEFMDEDNYI